MVTCITSVTQPEVAHYRSHIFINLAFNSRYPCLWYSYLIKIRVMFWDFILSDTITRKAKPCNLWGNMFYQVINFYFCHQISSYNSIDMRLFVICNMKVHLFTFDINVNAINVNTFCNNVAFGNKSEKNTRQWKYARRVQWIPWNIPLTLSLHMWRMH